MQGSRPRKRTDLCAHGWAGQTHTDLIVLEHNPYSFLVTTKLSRSHQANAHNAEAASASEASVLCVGGVRVRGLKSYHQTRTWVRLGRREDGEKSKQKC